MDGRGVKHSGGLLYGAVTGERPSGSTGGTGRLDACRATAFYQLPANTGLRRAAYPPARWPGGRGTPYRMPRGRQQANHAQQPPKTPATAPPRATTARLRSIYTYRALPRVRTALPPTTYLRHYLPHTLLRVYRARRALRRLLTPLPTIHGGLNVLPL